MIGKIVAALVGRELERRKGENGAKGALLGVVAAGALKRLGPIGLALGGAYVAKKVYDRSRSDA